MATSTRTRRARPVPTGRFALLVALVGLPVVLVRSDSWWPAAVGLAVVVAVAVGDGLAAVRPRDVLVTRSLPGTLVVGESSQIVWEVRSTADRSVRVVVADTIWPSFGASRRSSDFVLAPDRMHRFGARVEPQRRGRFPFGAVTVRTHGPLGLVALHHQRDLPDSVAVMPAHPSRERLRTRLRVPLETGIRSVRTRGTGTEFDQLREYRHGDEFRKVDWAATARHQHVVVRDYRAERNQHVVAMLDNGRIMAGRVGDAPRVEHAMDAVLGLTHVASHLGDNVGLLTFDSQVRGIVPARNARSQFGRVAEAMYLLDPALEESAYRTAFTSAASRFRRRSLFVVFTELVETVVGEELVPALNALTRTHLVVVACVRDPDIARWAGETGHARAATAYRSAAAIASIESRERAIARLRSMGAIVVDARPGDLAVDVVDTYIELKSTGRL